MKDSKQKDVTRGDVRLDLGFTQEEVDAWDKEIREASERSREKFANAYKELAK